MLFEMNWLFHETSNAEETIVSTVFKSADLFNLPAGMLIAIEAGKDLILRMLLTFYILVF